MAAIADPNPTHAGRETVAPFAGTALRSQAEAALRARRAAGLPSQNAASPEASQRALHELHELHVHQIELEMQNEELQRSQAELHAANRRYVDLYDQAPVGYFTVSEAGQILQTNRTASTMLGLARSALTQKAFTHFVVREDRDRYYLMCRALLKSGQAQSAELRLQRQDGTLFWAQLEANSAAHTSGAQQLRLVLSDISVRKALEAEREQGRANLEQEVKRRTQQYLDLYDQAPCGYHTLSAEGVVLRVNQTGLALLGYARDDFEGHHMVDFMTPPSAQVFRAALPRLLETGRLRNTELDLHCQDGSIRPFSIDSDVAKAAPGEAPLYHCTMVDISERRHNAQRLELALMGADLGLWDTQIASGEIHLSARACAMLGYPEGGLGTHTSALEALVHPDDAPLRRAALQAVYLGDVPYYRVEYRLRHKDGHWVWIRSHGKVVARDENANPLRAVGTLQDISQEKRLQLESTDLLQRIEALIQAVGKVADAPAQPVAVAPPVVIGAREQQVIQLIAAGCTSAEVGRKLGISTATAATHRRNLMRKLDLHSSAELTRYALAHKLVSN